ncbi:hypothetical protein BN2156_01889 [Mycolicibacterium neworleansense]|uniref:Uncharacterized protein n=2 Tax=Mycolicibacterium neworleansense TaxID=146018 RepID=A0A0H5RMP2_9MYCO|nr:hypothetical protein BN2156_01889 [Mycolicibacterium neworleansense]
MSAQLSEVRRDGNTLAVPFERPRVRPAKALRYELHVTAADIADVVTGIGGWLFDRALAGWHVSVAADDGADVRALRILGLKPVGLEGSWRSAESEVVAMTAVGASRPADHERPGRNGDVVFFGTYGADGLDGAQQVRYRPSAAALAFKGHALTVIGADPAAAGWAETLFRRGRSAGLLDADLVPVC